MRGFPTQAGPRLGLRRQDKSDGVAPGRQGRKRLFADCFKCGSAVHSIEGRNLTEWSGTSAANWRL